MQGRKKVEKMFKVGQTMVMIGAEVATIDQEDCVTGVVVKDIMYETAKQSYQQRIGEAIAVATVGTIIVEVIVEIIVGIMAVTTTGATVEETTAATTMVTTLGRMVVIMTTTTTTGIMIGMITALKLTRIAMIVVSEVDAVEVAEGEDVTMTGHPRMSRGTNTATQHLSSLSQSRSQPCKG